MKAHPHFFSTNVFTTHLDTFRNCSVIHQVNHEDMTSERNTERDHQSFTLTNIILICNLILSKNGDERERES